MPEAAARGTAQGALLRPVLWSLLVLSGAVNTVVSAADVNVVVSVLFGLATVGCAAGLIVHHYRFRRR
ncbi:hypothetical protein HNP84_001060 [Thermocatellispora tengchongensis]|uniref:Uncharacterized protein n=1 Tax=Thermocatellispora tengchongensis TaxID=1073253 RepID=A0A840NRT5_9ACTN|nr:hypothetical protein [Thermocatellispora tengchongensis]MBB5131354.1 hypothetical protein [Thermocatellispora tengchongensis]